MQKSLGRINERRFSTCLVEYYIGVFFLLVLPVGMIQAESTISKSDLGKKLFFDKRLSYNETKSCASCHDPQFAFTDRYRRSITADGSRTKVNSPSLYNVASLRFFGITGGSISSLDESIRRPLALGHPLEMGTVVHFERVLQRLSDDKVYLEAFAHYYPDAEDTITLTKIIQVLKVYLLTLKSENSAYDRYVAGDIQALTPAAQRGLKLFFSERFACSSCHPAPHFTLASVSGSSIQESYQTWPIHQKPVRIPSLRNVQLSWPYLHDGSVDSLDEAIQRHPGIGDSLFEEEMRDVIAFLFSLTEPSLEPEVK